MPCRLGEFRRQRKPENQRIRRRPKLRNNRLFAARPWQSPPGIERKRGRVVGTHFQKHGLARPAACALLLAACNKARAQPPAPRRRRTARVRISASSPAARASIKPSLCMEREGARGAKQVGERRRVPGIVKTGGMQRRQRRRIAGRGIKRHRRSDKSCRREAWHRAPADRAGRAAVLRAAARARQTRHPERVGLADEESVQSAPRHFRGRPPRRCPPARKARRRGCAPPPPRKAASTGSSTTPLAVAQQQIDLVAARRHEWRRLWTMLSRRLRPWPSLRAS